MSRILVVDDEPAIGWSLREMLTDDGHVVDVAATIDDALVASAQAAPEVILLDVRLPGRDGIAAIPDLRAAAPAAAVIVMTAFGDLDTAVRAVEAGAFDHLVKPFDLDHVVDVVSRALADRTLGSAGLRASGDDTDDVGGPAALIGSSAAMQEVFKRIALVAGTDMPVLLTGPAGTGMEETYQLTSALKHLPFGRHVALVTDARFSGVSTGACIGHVGPEALDDGPIGRVRDGDTVRIVIDRERLVGSVDVVGAEGRALTPDEAARLLAARPPHPGLAPHPDLPDDTRLWAALQRVGGGTWGGCVYDAEGIAERLARGWEGEG
jgi:CheY-like chemotaxis protein